MVHAIKHAIDGVTFKMQPSISKLGIAFFQDARKTDSHVCIYCWQALKQHFTETLPEERKAESLQNT